MQTIHLTNIHLGGATPCATAEAPTPPPPTPALPDAGRPHVYACDIDPTTLKVVVQACVDRAGEVKVPDGEVEYFDVEIPEKYSGIVYKYILTNHAGKDARVDLGGRGKGVLVDGTEELTEGVLPNGVTAAVYSPAGKFGDGKDFGNGVFDIRGEADGKPIAARFLADAKYRRTEEGNLLIERKAELVAP